MKLHPIYLIAAVDNKFGIGKNGKIPWAIRQDLDFFRKITTKTDSATRENLVIMGHSTWDSLPAAHRPLPGRRNIVLSRKDLKLPGAKVYHSLKDAFESADELIESVFVIGGGKVFAEAIRAKNLKGIYLTHVQGDFKCDTPFPKIPRSFKPTSLGRGEEKGVKFEFIFYKSS
ncbi:MAG: dihydrofolate reductase [Candidatus Peregrinibacteria bacterium]